MDNWYISSNALLPSLIFFCRLLCYEQHNNAYIMLNSNHFPLISNTAPPITLIHLAPCCNTYKEEQQALSNIILFLSFLRRPRQVLLWDSDVGYTLIRNRREKLRPSHQTLQKRCPNNKDDSSPRKLCAEFHSFLRY